LLEFAEPLRPAGNQRESPPDFGSGAIEQLRIQGVQTDQLGEYIGIAGLAEFLHAR
jgi:hypothetical protein